MFGALKDAIMAASDNSRNGALAAAESHQTQLRADLTLIAERYTDTPRLLAPLFANLADFRELTDEIAALLAQNRSGDAHALMHLKGDSIYRRQITAMSAVLDAERQRAAQLRAEAEDAQRTALLAGLILALATGGALAVMVLGYRAYITSHRPLMKLRGSLLALADGDTLIHVPYGDQPGPIGAMACAIQRFQDSIAERDAANAALLASDERLRAAVSLAPVAVYHLDRDLRYTWVHNCPLGFTPEELIGRHCAELFDPEGFAEREALFRRVLASGDAERSEVVLRLKGSTQAIHLDQIVAPLRNEYGQIVGLTCAAIDITDRERANRALMSALEEARRATDAKAHFLAAASHDLRQPMQAIRLFLDTLDPMITTTPARRVLDGALQALSAGEDLLRSYMDVSVMDSGLVVPVLRRVPVAEIVDDVLMECQSAIAAKGLSLSVVRSSSMVFTDPALLAPLLRNLVMNAVRFTDQGRLLIGCRHVGQALRIEVWDTGAGIAADKLGRVFDDFFQVGNTERDRTKGFGLGLSVVDRAARLLGHRITVNSQPGKGSVFAVTIDGCQRMSLPSGTGTQAVIHFAA